MSRPTKKIHEKAPTGPEKPVSKRRARKLCKEAQRLLTKRGATLSDVVRGRLEGDLGALELLLKERGDVAERAKRCVALDGLLSEHFPRYRKSVGREYVESILWAVAIALVIRAFLFEPFQIPTGSMIPSLHIGDHIFVSKFAYGVKVPLTDIRLFGNGGPERGEIVVFEYPGPGPDHGEDFIKRVVGVAGDRVRVENNRVYINDDPLLLYTFAADHALEKSFAQSGAESVSDLLWAFANRRAWGAVSCHDWTHESDDCVLQFEDTGEQGYVTQHGSKPRLYSAGRPNEVTLNWPYASNCRTLPATEKKSCKKREKPRSGYEFTIPSDSVFCMGDNRDNSHDSRFWGVVPQSAIKGRALFIWWAKKSDAFLDLDLKRFFRSVH